MSTKKSKIFSKYFQIEDCLPLVKEEMLNNIVQAERLCLSD